MKIYRIVTRAIIRIITASTGSWSKKDNPAAKTRVRIIGLLTVRSYLFIDSTPLLYPRLKTYPPDPLQRHLPNVKIRHLFCV